MCALAHRLFISSRQRRRVYSSMLRHGRRYGASFQASPSSEDRPGDRESSRDTAALERAGCSRGPKLRHGGDKGSPAPRTPVPWLHRVLHRGPRPSDISTVGCGDPTLAAGGAPHNRTETRSWGRWNAPTAYRTETRWGGERESRGAERWEGTKTRCGPRPRRPTCSFPFALCRHAEDEQPRQAHPARLLVRGAIPAELAPFGPSGAV
jgi:hypothetical protein